jgi:hypothetical protein
MNYTNGKIYKVICNVTGNIYIGSTITPLNERLRKHFYDYKRFKEGKTKYKLTSHPIIERGDYGIALIENYPCQSKNELHKRERHFVESLDCINKNIPTRTKDEYYQKNKAHIVEYKKKWYQDNKDREKEKQYRLNNKDAIKQYQIQYQKQYYEKNKDAINKKNRSKSKKI